MPTVEIKDLIEAGVHFGHKRRNWNPKMEPYIFCDKNGISIINLEKTQQLIDNACNFLKQCATQKKNIIFVGTKKHIAEVIKEEAIRCGVFYINRRWLGGLLTNFDIIRQRLNRLREMEEMQESGTLPHSNKKELSMFNKELEKLQKTLGGIKNMRGKPDVIYVIDGQREEIAVREAILTGVKVVAIIDTNCSPIGIDYPIPGNDDSIRSVKLITQVLANAIIEGHEGQIPNVHKPTQIRENYTKKQDNNKQVIQTVQEITASPVLET